MTPQHVATTTAALNAAATASTGPIATSAGHEMVRVPKGEFAAAQAAARQAGVAAERIRISAILNHEAAAGRGKLAAHLAFKTEMAAADAGEMLAASATEGSTFAAAAGAEVLDWNVIVAEQNARNSSNQGGTR